MIRASESFGASNRAIIIIIIYSNAAAYTRRSYYLRYTVHLQILRIYSTYTETDGQLDLAYILYYIIKNIVVNRG